MIPLKTNIKLKSTCFSKIRCIFVDISTVRIIFMYQLKRAQSTRFIQN